jgi:hypothetical protein
MYSSADSLPKPRWSGKLVRVRQALYLVGSVDSFTVPDGIIYRYSPSQNQWVIKDTMPAPYLHESSVCVFNDSLIICIGGSTTSFAGTTNVVRAYNPFKDKWLSAGNLPVNNTTGHAECRMADSSVVLVGGYGATFNNVVYHGKIVYSPAHDSLQDSIRITWTASALNDTTIFRTGVYRVGGGNAGEWMLFGPALRNSTTYNTIYTLGLTAPDTMYWKRLVPDIPDTAGNRPSLAVKYDTDSVWIFLFSGSKGFTTVRSSYRFSYARPAPIGLKQIAEIVPDEFMLYQNYPNPFNPVTRIRFSVQDDAHQQPVRVAVYDILGREIAMLVNNKLNAGIYEVEWNGNGHPSGIYFCRLTVESAGSAVIMKTQKMVLVK